MAKKKMDWKLVAKVEDSGRGYDRAMDENGKVISTADCGFFKEGDSIAHYRGKVYRIPAGERNED